MLVFTHDCRLDHATLPAKHTAKLFDFIRNNSNIEHFQEKNCVNDQAEERKQELTPSRCKTAAEKRVA